MSFLSDALAAGFSESQARFMDEFLAKHPHQHEIEDVDGLDEALEEAGLEFEEGDEEDENDETIG
jgi:hypothetical protein